MIATTETSTDCFCATITAYRVARQSGEPEVNLNRIPI
mgnify:CR=1 FL=1